MIAPMNATPHPPTSARRLLLGLGAAGLLLLSGCASMSEKECQRADWYAKGLSDGRGGQAKDLVDDHAEACAKVGIKPDSGLWRRGWQEGVQSYCTARRGWSEGVLNMSYRGACEGQYGEDAFMLAYQGGQRLYQLNQQLSRNHEELKRLDKQLREAKTDDERKRIRDTMRGIDIDQIRLRSLIASTEAMAPR